MFTFVQKTNSANHLPFGVIYIALEWQILVYYDPKELWSFDHINLNIIDDNSYRKTHTKYFPLKQNDVCFVQI